MYYTAKFIQEERAGDAPLSCATVRLCALPPYSPSMYRRMLMWDLESGRRLLLVGYLSLCRSLCLSSLLFQLATCETGTSKQPPLGRPRVRGHGQNVWASDPKLGNINMTKRTTLALLCPTLYSYILAVSTTTCAFLALSLSRARARIIYPLWPRS